jgi:hypothetical protein
MSLICCGLSKIGLVPAGLHPRSDRYVKSAPGSQELAAIVAMGTNMGLAKMASIGHQSFDTADDRIMRLERCMPPRPLATLLQRCPCFTFTFRACIRVVTTAHRNSN